jgi:hypothetical protein
MTAGKIVMTVVGALLALVAIALIAAGSGLLWAFGTQRDDDGFFTSSDIELATEGYALTSGEIDLGARPGEWFPTGRVGTVRLSAESRTDAPLFIGIGAESDVDAFLAGVARAEVTRVFGGRVTYVPSPGEQTPSRPGEETYWVAMAAGLGAQEITWDLEQGEWVVVIMNADASQGVTADVSAAARLEILVPIAFGLLIGGIVMGTVAAGLLVAATRRAAGAPAAAGGVRPQMFGGYPLRLEGDLDPGLTRWQWLIKWFLALPHFIVLAILWSAFMVLTIVAGLAILFTGRYPRSIFDFNVGVMRWSWRVAFYCTSALGTDRYPPFTLAETDYPARLDVAYPEELSRGLVLVKWWLLAIPHYLIVGLFTSGLVWWTTDLGDDSGQAVLEAGGGLISVLVLVAGIALLFTGRYPQGLFDLIMGLNRWVYRVWAYAALMRDEYPPFRLDPGGTEQPEPTPSAPNGSAGNVPPGLPR